jgi:hypothetical protein
MDQAPGGPDPRPVTSLAAFSACQYVLSGRTAQGGDQRVVHRVVAAFEQINASTDDRLPAPATAFGLDSLARRHAS